MRALIDECLPRQLQAWLEQHVQATTVAGLGWKSTKNGKLLRAANDAGFDVLLTADQNMFFQQNLDGIRIAVLVVPTNRKRLVQKCVAAVVQSLSEIQPGQKVVMDLGRNADAWQSMRLHAIEDGDHYTTHRFKPGSLPDSE